MSPNAIGVVRPTRKEGVCVLPVSTYICWLVCLSLLSKLGWAQSKVLNEEMTCPICLSVIRETYAVMECFIGFASMDFGLYNMGCK